MLEIRMKEPENYSLNQNYTTMTFTKTNSLPCIVNGNYVFMYDFGNRGNMVQKEEFQHLKESSKQLGFLNS